MSLSVAIRRGGSTVYTFSIAPFVEPENAYEFTTTEPPNLVSNTKTWTLEGKLYGASTAALQSNYAALLAVLEAPAALPDGIQILNGATPIEQIGSEGGYLGFGVRELKINRTDLEWRTELAFTMKVEATKRFAPVNGSTISSMVQTESYTYDEAGLLTHTLSGEITVTSGSALTVAQSLGLKLPSPAFAYSTNGPGGVNVDILDLAGLSARFTSIIVQTAQALPGGVGPSYTKSLTVERTSLGSRTTITARGIGPNAAAAVAAERPSPCLGETIATNPYTLEASATFITEQYAYGSLVRTRTLTTTGGGTPTVYTPRTGGRDPAKHNLPKTAVEIVETIRVTVIGTPSADDFKIPAPIPSLDEDTGAMAFDPMPTLTKPGSTPAGNLWEMGLRRVYRGTKLSQMFPSVMLGVLSAANAPPSNKPSGEIARKDK